MTASFNGVNMVLTLSPTMEDRAKCHQACVCSPCQPMPPPSERDQHSWGDARGPGPRQNAHMIERITADPDLLGECPVWDSDSEVLWWVDIEGRALRRYEPKLDTLESRELTGRPGSLALTARPGRLLVAMEHQVGWFDWITGSWNAWQDLEQPETG